MLKHLKIHLLPEQPNPEHTQKWPFFVILTRYLALVARGNMKIRLSALEGVLDAYTPHHTKNLTIHSLPEPPVFIPNNMVPNNLSISPCLSVKN
jgi:hypothetical protein